MRILTESRDDRELATLMKDVCDGRLEALDRIWDLCADDMYALALWRTGSVSDAEDALQEAFVCLARGPRSLRGVRQPRAYLLRMVRNAAVKVARSRRESPTPDEVVDLVSIEPDLDDGIDGTAATRFLDSLPVRQREVVFLRYFADLSFREIANVVGAPLFTVTSRHRLAIGRLRRCLGVMK